MISCCRIRTWAFAAIVLSGSCWGSNPEPVAPLVPLFPDSADARLYDQLHWGTVAVRGAGGNGSGFLVDSSGLVLTHAALVDTASSVRVILPNGYVVPGLVASRKIGRALVLLSVDVSSCDSCTPLPLVDSTWAPVRGERMLSIAAGASLATSVTVGGLVNVAPSGLAIYAMGERGSLGAPVVDQDGRVVATTSFPVGDSCPVWMGAVRVPTPAQVVAVRQAGVPRPLPGSLPGATDSLGSVTAPIASSDPSWWSWRGAFAASVYAPAGLVYATRVERHCEPVTAEGDRFTVDRVLAARRVWSSWDEYLSGRMQGVVVIMAPTMSETFGSQLGRDVVGSFLASLFGIRDTASYREVDQDLKFEGTVGSFTLYRDGNGVWPLESVVRSVTVHGGAEYVDHALRITVHGRIDGITKFGIGIYPPTTFAPRPDGSFPAIDLVVVGGGSIQVPVTFSLEEKYVRAIWDDVRPSPGRTIAARSDF